VLIKSIRDTKNNIGVFVKSITGQLDKTLAGKVILAYTEDITAGKIFQAWARDRARQLILPRSMNPPSMLFSSYRPKNMNL
jgi:hypothetical protein